MKIQMAFKKYCKYSCCDKYKVNAHAVTGVTAWGSDITEDANASSGRLARKKLKKAMGV